MELPRPGLAGLRRAASPRRLQFAPAPKSTRLFIDLTAFLHHHLPISLISSRACATLLKLLTTSALLPSVPPAAPLIVRRFPQPFLVKSRHWNVAQVSQPTLLPCPLSRRHRPLRRLTNRYHQNRAHPWLQAASPDVDPQGPYLSESSPHPSPLTTDALSPLHSSLAAPKMPLCAKSRLWTRRRSP
jgi:hypothetical protein